MVWGHQQGVEWLILSGKAGGLRFSCIDLRLPIHTAAFQIVTHEHITKDEKRSWQCCIIKHQGMEAIMESLSKEMMTFYILLLQNETSGQQERA